MAGSAQIALPRLRKVIAFLNERKSEPPVFELIGVSAVLMRLALLRASAWVSRTRLNRWERIRRAT